MVGTAVYQVGCASSSQWKKRSALKPGVQQIEPPAASEDSTAAIRPWMWNSGMTLRQRSAGVSASVAPMWRAEAARLRCEQRHDLGPRRGARGVQHQGDVVLLRRQPLARRCRRDPPPRARSQPAGRSAGRDEPQDRGTVPAGHRDRRARRRLPPRSAPWRAGRRGRSRTPPRGRRGSAAPWWRRRRLSTNAAAISGPFGSTIATRSPRPMPQRVERRHRRVRELAQAAEGQRSAGPAPGSPRPPRSGAEQVPDGFGHRFLGSWLCVKVGGR